MALRAVEETDCKSVPHYGLKVRVTLRLAFVTACASKIGMTFRLAALACLAFALPTFAAPPPIEPPVAVAAAEDHHDYCRFTGDDVRGKLETAIVTMKNAAGVTVELVGAIHIADASYYEKLNDVFKGYEVLLFELVDGQNLKEKLEWKESKKNPKKPKAPSEAKPATGNSAKAKEEPADDEVPKNRPPRRQAEEDSSDRMAFTILHGMMTGMGSFLRLTYQTDGVDYTAKNFVHADVSMAEFQRLQDEKGESWMKLFQKSIEAQLKRGPRKGEEPRPSQLLLALLGDSSGIKISMARMLGNLEAQAEDFGMGGDSVIVGERNRVALEVFDREVKAGRKNLGIFYGAAHLDNMEKRLEARGYKRTAERWLTAWDIKPRSDEKK